MRPTDSKRTRFLSAAFNITPAEWEVVSAYQQGVCFVCGRPERGKRLSTDHSHEDGLFRGLLCSKCNPLLGKLENAFKRYGLHKVYGITLLIVIKRFAMYLANPPAEAALGRRVYGYPGRIGTKAFRKWVKKK
jgi:Recombination endonuclease VII